MSTYSFTVVSPRLGLGSHAAPRPRAIRWGAVASAVVVTGMALTASREVVARRTVTRVEDPAGALAPARLAALPVRFEANRGQSDPSVRYLARAGGSSLFLTDDELVLATTPATAGTAGGKSTRTPTPAPAVIRMGLVGAHPSAVEGTGVLPGTSNYYLGTSAANWVRAVPGYSEVRYRALHPGIDLVVHSRRGPLEYDFEVAPGADPANVALQLSGMSSARIDRSGDLVLKVVGGTVRQHRPVAYQDTAAGRRRIDASFTVDHDRVGFRIGTYDHAAALVIDPTLAYSTYLGGAGEDEGHAVAVDDAGAAYVTGRTTAPDFPTKPAQAGNSGSVAFVSKLAADGATLVYSSYFGGTGGDAGSGIALHDGTAYVTGTTSSADFPTTAGAYSRRCGLDGACSGGDGFVSTFGPTGALAYSTYLGGRADDQANAIAVGTDGRAYVTGATRSASFPTTPGAYAPRCGADADCYRNATFTDGASTDGSTTFTSDSAAFSGDDVGKEITAGTLAPSTTIAGVTDASTVELSQPAIGTGTGSAFSIADATFTDGASTAGSTTYTSELPHFLSADVGHPISGENLPDGTTVDAYISPTQVTLSRPAAATGTRLTFTIARSTFTDGASTIGAPTYGSATPRFTAGDVGHPISGTNIPADTTVAYFVNTTTVGLSAAATATGSGLTFTVDRNTFTDGYADGSTFYSFGSVFRSSDVGKGISGDKIVPGTTITALLRSDGFSVSLSRPTTASGFGSYSIARDTSNDGVSTSASTTFTSATAGFTAGDVGKGISGTNIPGATTITAVGSATTVTLSNPASDSGTGLTFTIARNTFSDGVSFSDNPPYTSASANFAASDVGRAISGDNLAPDATIDAVTSATSVQLSRGAVATGSPLTFTVDRGRDRTDARQFAFVAALDPAGAGDADLAYGSYLGGFGDTSGAGIALDGTQPVVVGSTSAADLPTNDGAQPTFAGGQDAFVAHLSLAGAGAADLVWSSFLGGGGNDAASAVAVDTGGRTYLTGSTGSGDFPLRNPIDDSYCTDCDNNAFVTRLAPSGALDYSTYLGGSTHAYDVGRAIAVDGAGSAYVAGVTSSPDFPTVHAVLYKRGERDAFVTKLASDGGSLGYSTYLGGSGTEEADAIAVTSSGLATITGVTSPSSSSSVADFPITPGALDGVCGSDGTCDPNGAPDAFVTRFGPGDLPGVSSISPRGGPITVGTQVLISGSDFTGATSVRFGGTAVSYSVLSDTVIRATTPVTETPALVPVAVITPIGRSLASDAASFRYGEGLFTPAPACALDGCAQGVAVLPSGKVLALHGEGGRESQLYDPVSGTWSSTGSCANLPGTGGPQGCSSDFPEIPMTVLSGPPSSCGANCGKVLVSGGYGSGGQLGDNLRAAFLYDPASGAWRRTADMSVPRVNHSATLLPDGTVLVAGGCRIRYRGCGPSGGTPEVSAEIYHPDTETWTAAPDAFAGHAVSPAVLLDPAVGPCGALCGKVLVVGGVSNGAQQDAVEAYDPVARSWSVQPPLQTPRYAMPALQLPDGSVVAVGGYNAQRDTSELLPLAGGDWVYTNPMVTGSDSEGDAVRLPNGKVFSVAGGSAAQLFDGPSDTWTATGPRIHNFAHMSLAMLASGPSSACGTNCGKVLIVGDGDAENSGQQVADLYTPRPRVTGVSAATGLTTGGTTVTVTGTGLTTVSSVRFGDANGTNLSHDPDSPDTRVTVTVPAHIAGPVDVTAFGPAGRSPVTPAGTFTFSAAGVTTTTTATSGTSATTTPGATSSTLPTGTQVGSDQGYTLAAADGGVFTFGSAPFAGSAGGARLAQPIVAVEHTPSGRGYWLAGADGGVFAFGDARFLGSTGGIRLARPIVGMRASPTGNGYFLVASDGGVFAFGDARFRGSTGAIRLNAPVVGIERTASGNGYWLVGADGGVFAFGDAVFHGSTGAMRLAQPVVAVTRSAGGAGYVLAGADGGVFAFGDATFRGSTGGARLNSPIVAMAPTPGGGGYWLCAGDGGVFAFGNAQFKGSMGGSRLSQPVVGCTSA